MSKPTVVFDIDGVLADFTYGFTRAVTNDPRSQGTQETWDFEWKPEIIRSTWKHIDRSKTFWYDLPPLVTPAEAVEMQRLHSARGIIYLTGRREGDENNVAGQTYAWMVKHDLPLGRIVLTDDKIATIRELGLNPVGIIDDKPDLVMDFAMAAYPIYVRDWRYNRELPTQGLRQGIILAGNVHRVSSVGEFVSRVQSGQS